ncbi:MAG TPA: STAS domain-containing protein [Methylophilaceae bacterium]|jgi:phospholipid transport system transporter-binding protein
MPLFTQQGNKLAIHSAITVDTVATLLGEVIPLLKSPLEIDLEKVPDVDSSAISLMFEWLRLAKQNNAVLSYCNLPENLTSLAALYGVLEMIPQHKSN